MIGKLPEAWTERVMLTAHAIVFALGLVASIAALVLCCTCKTIIFFDSAREPPSDFK
jgi:hypothetical protein